jgi:sporulation protein YlmC with PRC-barrel domain
MYAKQIILALLGTALLASVASAQTPATSERSEAKSSAISESSLKGDWRASKVVGLSVYNDTNEKVGSINELLMDKSGNIKAVVLGVGGFLGMGEHLVAIPFEKIKFVTEPVAYTSTSSTTPGSPTPTPGATPSNRPPTTTGSAGSPTASQPNPWYPDHAVFNASKDELKAMPEFKYSS